MALDTIKAVAIFDGAVDTADLADNAVTVAKIDTLTGDVSFADNAKAIFGAGSDLQIYHDGTDSFIGEYGIGSLAVRATDLFLQDASGYNYIHGDNTGGTGGTVKIFHDNSLKLTTTSTGIDVTGTVTADGLTVDGTTSATVTLTSSVNGCQISYNDLASASTWNTGIANDGTADFLIYANNQQNSAIRLYTDGVLRQNIASNGDISFYEDTGTTPKLFWDASAENLGLGTTSPVASNSNHRAIQIHHADIYQAQLRLTNSTSGAGANDGFNIQFDGTHAYLVNQESTGDIIAYTNSNERMRIDSSGNVSVKSSGTTTPTYDYSTLGEGLHFRYWDQSGARHADIVATGNTPAGATQDLRFFTNSGGSPGTANERMRIESNGEVFMGTTSHYGDSIRLCLRGAGSNNGGVLEIQHDRNAGGGRDFIRFYNDTGGEAGGIEHSSSTGVSYQTSSDYRLKENVVDLTGAIQRIKQLPVRQFNFIGEDQTVDGFLAHEAQAVVPESASGTKDQIKVWEDYDELPDGVSIGDPKLDEEGNTIPVYQGIDQSKLVPLLTGALKEAIARIETLEQENTSIKSRLDALEGN